MFAGTNKWLVHHPLWMCAETTKSADKHQPNRVKPCDAHLGNHGPCEATPLPMRFGTCDLKSNDVHRGEDVTTPKETGRRQLHVASSLGWLSLDPC